MLKELRAKHQAFIEEAKGLQKEYEASQDAAKLDEINAVMDKADEVKGQIETAEKAADSLARIEALAAPVAPVSAAPVADTLAGIKVEEVLENDPTGGFAGLGDFARAVFRNSPINGGVSDSRLDFMKEKSAASGLNAGNGAEGGYTVPAQHSNFLWTGMQNNPQSLLSMTDQYNVEGESLTLLGIDETDRTSNVWGGTQGYWLSEAAQMTSSKPKFREVKLEPKQLAVFSYATEKVLSTSGNNLEQIIGRSAMSAIDYMVSDAIINGTGAGQPLGIVTGSGKVSQAKVSGQTATTIVARNIDDMMSRQASNLHAGSIWLVNQDCIPVLESLETANGQSLWRGPEGLASGTVGTLKGLPVVVSEFCQTLGTHGDIILANMNAYATGVQGGVMAENSIHLRFDYAEKAFRWMFAVDGQSWVSSPTTPKYGSNTQAPFVTLATRA